MWMLHIARPWAPFATCGVLLWSGLGLSACLDAGGGGDAPSLKELPRPTPTPQTGAKQAPSDGSENSPPATKRPATPDGAGAEPTRAEVVDLILRPGLSELTVEGARERFSALRLEKEDDSAAAWLVLHSTSPGHALNVGFSRGDKGGPWHFADLKLDIPLRTGSEAQAVFDELTTKVQERLGGAKWERDQTPYTSRGYELDAKFDVNVGAVMNSQEGEPYVAIAIIPKPRD